MAKHKKYIESTLRTGIQTASVDDVGIKLKASIDSPFLGAPAVNPNTFTGILEDLDFQDPAIQALSNGAAVSAWGNATQATVSQQPTKQADGVLFDGDTDQMTFPRHTNVKCVIWVGHFTADLDNWSPILSDSIENPFHGGGSAGGSGGKLVEFTSTSHLNSPGVQTYLNGLPVSIASVPKPVGTPIILVVNYDPSNPSSIQGIGSQNLSFAGRYFNGTVKRAMLFDRNLTPTEIVGAIKHLGDLYSVDYNIDTVGGSLQVADLFQYLDPYGVLTSRIDGTGSYDGLVSKIKKGNYRQYDADPSVLLEWQTFSTDPKWMSLINNQGESLKYRASMGVENGIAYVGGFEQAELALVARGGNIIQTTEGRIDFNTSWGRGLMFPADGSSKFKLGDVDEGVTGRYFSYGTDETDEFIMHGYLNMHGHRIVNIGAPEVAGVAASIETTVKPVRLATAGSDIQSWPYSEYGWIRRIQGTESEASPFNIDGVPIAVGDVILVTNRANAWENGIYFVQNGGGFWGLERTADFNLYLRSGLTVGVREGAVNAGKAFISRLTGTDTETGFFNGQVEPFPNTLVIEFIPMHVGPFISARGLNLEPTSDDTYGIQVLNPNGPSGDNGAYTFSVNPVGQLYSRDLHTEDHAYIGGSVFTGEIRGGALLRFHVESGGVFRWNNASDVALMELTEAGVLDLKGNKIANVLDPVDPQDAATKAYTIAYADAAIAAAVAAPGGPASLHIVVDVPESFAGDFTATLVYGSDLSPLKDSDGNLKISALVDSEIDAGTYYWTDADPVYGMVFRYNNDVDKSVFLSEIITHFQSVVPHSRVQMNSFSGDTTMSDLTATITPIGAAAVSAGLLHLDGTDPMLADLNMAAWKITNLANPVSSQDAATKGYVDVGSVPTLITPPGTPATGQKWILFTPGVVGTGNKFGDVQLPEMTGMLEITLPDDHQIKTIIWYGDGGDSIQVTTTGDDAGFIYWEVNGTKTYGESVDELNAAIFAEYGISDAVTFTVPADADILHVNDYAGSNFYIGTGSAMSPAAMPRLQNGSHKFAQKMTIVSDSQVNEVIPVFLSPTGYTPDGIVTMKLCPDLAGVPDVSNPLVISAPLDLSALNWPGGDAGKNIYTVFENTQVPAGIYWLVIEFEGHTAGVGYADSVHMYTYSAGAENLYYYDGSSWTDTTYTLALNIYSSTDTFPMVLFNDPPGTSSAAELFMQGTEGDTPVRIKVPAPSSALHATNKLYVDTYVTDAIAAIDFPETGANTSLSNLTSPTSINQDLIPDTDNSRVIGSAAKAWNSIYANYITSKAGQALNLITGVDDGISITAGGSAQLSSAFSPGKILALTGNDRIDMATAAGGFIQANTDFSFFGNQSRTLKMAQSNDPGNGWNLTIEGGLANDANNVGGQLILRGGLGQGTQAAIRNKIVLDGGFVQVGTGTGAFTEGAQTDNSILMNSDADVVTRLSMRSSGAEGGIALGQAGNPHWYAGSYTGKHVLYASPLYNAAALNFNGGFEIGNVLGHNNVISDTLLKINGYQHVQDFFKVEDTILGDVFGIDSGGNVNAYGHRVANIAAPATGTDATNKDYVDALFAGLDPKASVRVATTANITLSGPQTIDGVAAIAGDRVLVKDQTLGEENGIYVVAAGAWARSADADGTPSNEVSAGMYCFVSEGTLNLNKFFFLATDDPIVVGTTPLVFSILAIAPTVLAFNKYNRTLDGTDITNQYIDLPHEVETDSLDVVVDGLWMEEGDDYTLSVVASVTRITFAGDLATGGATPLIAGDRIQTRYAHE